MACSFTRDASDTNELNWVDHHFYILMSLSLSLTKKSVYSVIDEASKLWPAVTKIIVTCCQNLVNAKKYFQLKIYFGNEKHSILAKKINFAKILSSMYFIGKIDINNCFFRADYLFSSSLDPYPNKVHYCSVTNLHVLNPNFR